jgi:hypothetical protein
MTRIPLSKKILPDKYWLVYVNENGDRKHIDLSGCAGSFARNTGYVSEDGLRAVGWRYEEQDQVCYELFNVGHTVVFAPKKPGLVQTLGYMLSGKKPEEAHKGFLASFEEALNRGGWKTVEREAADK